MQIWDTAGHERFAVITSAYLRAAIGIIITYDITNRKSFDQIKTNYYEKAKLHCDPNFSLVIVGNKSDLHNERKV